MVVLEVNPDDDQGRRRMGMLKRRWKRGVAQLVRGCYRSLYLVTVEALAGIDGVPAGDADGRIAAVRVADLTGQIGGGAGNPCMLGGCKQELTGGPDAEISQERDHVPDWGDGSL